MHFHYTSVCVWFVEEIYDIATIVSCLFVCFLHKWVKWVINGQKNILHLTISKVKDDSDYTEQSQAENMNVLLFS